MEELSRECGEQKGWEGQLVSAVGAFEVPLHSDQPSESDFGLPGNSLRIFAAKVCVKKKIQETSALTMEKHKGMTALINKLHDTGKHERGREK